MMSHSLSNCPDHAGTKRPRAALALAAGLLLSLGTAALAQDADPVVARVNGAEIRESEIALAEEELRGDAQSASPAAQRDQVIDYVTTLTLAAKLAEERQIAESVDFKRRLALVRKKVLTEILVGVEVRASVTDEAMRKVYDEQVKPLAAEQGVRARHILVETETEAKSIFEQLKSGANFADLAKEKSRDAQTAAVGGDLDFMTENTIRTTMVPEFAETVLKLVPGNISNPIKTEYGWHIIRVEEKGNRQVPEFDQIKSRIAAHLAQVAQTTFITSLRKDAAIERLEGEGGTKKN